MQTREQLIYSEKGIQISLIREPDASQVSVILRAGATERLSIVVPSAFVSRLAFALLEDWHAEGGDPAEELCRLLRAHEIGFEPLESRRSSKGLN